MNVHACTICGTIKSENETWFLMVENYWRDSLKIMCWDENVASHDSIFQVCGPVHGTEFLQAWVTSSELPRISSAPAGLHFEKNLIPMDEAKVVGNLLVHRQSMKNTPEGLKSLTDAVFWALKNEFTSLRNEAEQKRRPQNSASRVSAARAS